MVKSGEPKRGLFRLLKRAGKATPERSVHDEHALWLLHERTLTALRESAQAGERVQGHVAKQRGAIDSAADRTRALVRRSTDLSAGLTRVDESLDRLTMVALNASLEGSRLGESVGQALRTLGDELRSLVARASDALSENAISVAELGTELETILGSIERTRQSANEISDDAAVAQSTLGNTERSLMEMGERIRRATGSDPETVRAIAEAAEHARALVVSITALSGRVPSAIIASTLRPVLEALARLLPDEDGSERSK